MSESDLMDKPSAVSFISDKIEADSMSICKDYPIIDKLESKSIYKELMAQHNIGIDDIIVELKNRSFGFMESDWAKLGKFGLMSWTPDGQLLRSALEYKFYNKILDSKLSKLTCLIDGYYPCKHYKYDFYFPQIDVYIEIAGLMNIPEYVDQMQKKQKLYNCIVSCNPIEFSAIIDRLVSLSKEKGVL
jgi:hypothetical protein